MAALFARDTNSVASGQNPSRSQLQFLYSQRQTTIKRLMDSLHSILHPRQMLSEENLCPATVAKPYALTRTMDVASISTRTKRLRQA